MVLKFVFLVHHLIINESRVVDVSQKVHFFVAETILRILSEVFKLFICIIDEERILRLCCLLDFLFFLLLLNFLSHALEELPAGVESPHLEFLFLLRSFHFLRLNLVVISLIVLIRILS